MTTNAGVEKKPKAKKKADGAAAVQTSEPVTTFVTPEKGKTARKIQSTEADAPTGIAEIVTDFNDRITEGKIEIELIDRSETQPRKVFDEAAIAELGESIRTRGQLQSILVRPKGDRYELVFGERRWRATKQTGLRSIRANIAELSDEEVFDIQVHENLHRRDLQPLEEAESYAHLLTTVKLSGQPLTEEQLANRLKKPILYVVKRLLLNNLVGDAKEDLRAGTLPLNLALVLVEFAKSEEAQSRAYQYCYQTKWDSAAQCDVPLKSRPVNVRYLRDKIHSEILLALDTAPFPIDSPELRDDRLICPECPQRTGANRLFFEDAKNDFCMNPVCFEQKKTRFVQIQRARIGTEIIVDKIKADYQAKIEQARQKVEKAKDVYEKQDLMSKTARLDAELNEVNKFGIESSFAKTTAAMIEKAVEKVLQITVRYYSGDPAILGTQSYTAIKNSTQRCDHVEKAVCVDDQHLGQVQEICRSKSCKKHHSSSGSSIQRETKTGDELIERKAELFKIRTAEKTRVKVITDGKEKLGAPQEFFADRFFRRLMAATLLEYSSGHSYSHRHDLTAELLGVDRKDLSGAKSSYKFDVDVFARIDALEKFDDEKVMKIIFLLLTASFAENRHEGNDISSDSVEFIADKLGIDIVLLDAEARVELCREKYKKYLLLAENHLSEVKKSDENSRRELKAPDFFL